MAELREAIYAGSFYPAKKDKLLKMVKGFLSKAKTAEEINYKKIRAAIVPHAGYEFSGPVAAFAYNAMQEAKPEKIILIGPSHHAYFEGAFTFKNDWVSPLGKVKVKPAKLPAMENDMEHSLEVQLPFLQAVLKKFSLTPVIYGDISQEGLYSILKKEKGFYLVSSDLSHYLPYEDASKEDKETINAILNLDEEMLDKTGDACGKTGIGALLILAKKNHWKPVLLDYRNSGDTFGDKEKVVGYAAVVFTEQ